MTISFEGRVAIVTGAGGGLGRAYALELARRGAKLMVNDVGGASAVVDEIRAAGGTAIASAANVADLAAVEAMVAEAKAELGGVHILINNAGILRDKSFAKMDMADFRAVLDVHLVGSACCTHAVWETMRAQNYGRVLMTASSTGLYGNFGQANYGAAKMGLVGLARTLAIEGARHNVRVNTIAPVAATRMTEKLFPAELLARFEPAMVAPAALYLVSDDAPTGAILGAGAGVVQAVHVTLTRGAVLDEPTPEAVAEQWAAIGDRAGETVPQSGAEQTMAILERLRGQ